MPRTPTHSRRESALLLGCAAVSSLITVLIGAFGAHVIAETRAQALIETGAAQQALHVAGLIGAAFARERGARAASLAGGLFVIGTALFCGALYALALGAPRPLAALAPVGGLTFLAGWAALAFAAFGLYRSASSSQECA